MTEFLSKNRHIANICLLLTAVIWGSGFIGVRFAGNSGFTPELILFSRFAVASLTSFLIFRKKIRGFTKAELIYGTLTGFLLFTAFYFQTIGIRNTTTSNNAFLTSVCVIVVPFFEWLVFKKRPRPMVFASALIAITGVYILTGAGGLKALNLGDIQTLTGSMLFSCHILFLSIAVKKVDTVKLLFLQVASCTVFSAAAVAALGGLLLPQDIDVLRGTLCVVYLGIFSTCLAFLMQTAAQKISSPTTVTVILSTEALFASIFSVAIGDEPLTSSLIIGGIIIMSAVLLLSKREKIPV